MTVVWAITVQVTGPGKILGLLEISGPTLFSLIGTEEAGHTARCLAVIYWHSGQTPSDFI